MAFAVANLQVLRQTPGRFTWWVYREDGATLATITADNYMAAASRKISVGDAVWFVGSDGVRQCVVTASAPNVLTVSTITAGATDSFGYPLDASDPLEALAIGTAGTGSNGLPSTHKVAAIVSFNNTLAQALLRPDNLATAFLNNDFSIERNRRATSDTSVGLMVDPYFTGRQDAGDGVVAGFADMIAFGSGKMTLKVRPATAGEKAVMGTRSNSTGPSWTDRRMAWANVSYSLFGAYRGNVIIDIRYRINSPSGWSLPASSVASSIGSSGKNPGFANWALKAIGGSEAQGDGTTGGEYDLVEMHYEWRHTTRASGVSGGTGTSGAAPDVLQIQRNQFGPSGAITAARSSRLNDSFVVQAGPNDQTYDDDGTGGNFDALWELQGGPFNATLTPFSAAFDDTQWAGQEMTVEYTAIRISIPTGLNLVTPIVSSTVATVAQSETGSKVINLPSTAAVWGAGSWTEMLRWMHPIDTNGPGRTDEMTGPRATSSSLPVGLAQDLSGRTVTLTLGTFKKPGAVIGLLYAQDANTGFCRPHRVVIRVAPLLAIVGPTTGNGVIASTPFSFVIPRDDGSGVTGRYWSCGNLAYGAPGVGGLEVISKPAWMTWTAATRTLSGTAPSDITGLTSVTFRCTNGAGDYTEQTVDFVNPAWSPAEIASGQRVFVLDPKDTTTVPGADAAAVGTVTDRYTAGRTLGATGGQEPTIKAAGGPSGAHRTLAFNGSQMLKATLGANNSGLIDLFDTANFTTGSGYACFYAKTSAAGVQRFFGCYNSSGGSSMAYRHGASDRGCGYNVGTARTVVQATQDTSWHVIELIKAANAITVTLDGTDIATGTVTDTGALDAVQFLIGGYRTASTDTAGFTGEVYRGVCLNTVPDGVTVKRSDIRTWVAAA